MPEPPHVNTAPGRSEQALKSRAACNTASSFLYCRYAVALPLLSAKFLPISMLMLLIAPSEPMSPGTAKFDGLVAALNRR